MTQPQVREAPTFAWPASRRLVDTHVHLDDARFIADRDEVIARAEFAAVDCVLMGLRPETLDGAVALADRHGLRCAVGVHPNFAEAAGDQLEAHLTQLAEAPCVAAIGEIGLDYHRDHAPAAVQRAVLRRQLALALELDLPIVLHNRDATEDLLRILGSYPGLRGVFHCFLGDGEQAQRMLELGFHLGIGGPLTYRRNGALREVVAQLPLERLLLETDSPYLAPEPHRGERNEPAYVVHVAEALARIRGQPLDQIADQTTQNARRLFGG